MLNTDEKNKETTIHQRQLTDQEKSKMRRSHWVLIPAVLIPIFIIWVVSLVDDLPTVARYGAYAVGCGAMLVFLWKQSQLETDLKVGEAEVVRGIVEDKIKFGGTRKRSSGGIRSRSKNSSQPTYIIKMGGKKYWVRAKTFKQAEKGAFSEMVWLPKSQYVISIVKTT